jgi:hypothetical protein
MHQCNYPSSQQTSHSYKAIMATTATIPAKMLPFITRSCPPSLSAPLLLDEELDELPSPCENESEPLLVCALPLDESVAVEPAEAADEELPESLLPELPELP